MTALASTRRPAATGLTAALALALALAPVGAGAQSRAQKPQKAPAPNNQGVPFAALPPQILAPGQCGLFLWARTTPPRLILMAVQNPGVARVSYKGKTLDLPLTAWDGEVAFGQYETQTFTGDGLTLTVTIRAEPATGLLGGAVVRQASVQYRDAEGWETVIATAGMIACQT